MNAKRNGPPRDHAEGQNVRGARPDEWDSSTDRTERLISVGEVAQKLSVSPDTIRRLKDRDAMPSPVRIGRALRWRSVRIDEWIRAGAPSDWRAAVGEGVRDAS